MITYSTWSPLMPARSSAALMAKPPKSIAVKLLKAPDSFPIGVRAPATMTEPGIVDLSTNGSSRGRGHADAPPRLGDARIRLRVHTYRPRRNRRPRPREEHRL